MTFPVVPYVPDAPQPPERVRALASEIEALVQRRRASDGIEAHEARWALSVAAASLPREHAAQQRTVFITLLVGAAVLAIGALLLVLKGA